MGAYESLAAAAPFALLLPEAPSSYYRTPFVGPGVARALNLAVPEILW